KATLDVVLHRRAIALGWCADPGAAGRQHHQTVVCRHLLKTLAAQLFSRLQADIAGLAVLAAVAAARRMIDAVECSENVERRIDAATDLDDLAEATAAAPCSAGIRTQLLAPEDQRRLRLRDLDRGAAHAAGIGGRREPVLRKARTGAAVAGDR